MKYIDLHCDCINRLYYCEKKQNILKNSFHVDIEKLKKGECFIQTFAVFLDEEFVSKQNLVLFDEFENMLNSFYYQIDLAEDHICNISNNKNNKNDLMFALISSEGCGYINDDIEKLNFLYKSGVKMASLTWNYENCLAYPNSLNDSIMRSGLKKTGFKAIEFFNENKIIADISHLSDGGAKDV